MSDSRDPQKPLTGQQQYNVVSDTVTGVNVRWRDNLFQAVAILACLGLGVLIGWLAAADPVVGMLAGGFLGLIVGLLGSGAALMVFRAARHAQGKHD